MTKHFGWLGKGDRLSKEVPEWEELRNMACATKLYSNSHLMNYWWSLKTMRVANGAYVYWARMRMSIVILFIHLNQHGVKHFIKSKSMLGRGIRTQPFLENKELKW